MKYFNELLSNIHRNSYINKLKTPSRQLKGAGSDLAKLTDAFATIRLNEIFDNSVQFNKRLEKLKIDLENNPQAKPFGDLINTILKKFKPISDAEKEVFSKKGILAQKSILIWYIETNKYQKAITLAREFIVTKYLLEIMKINPNQLLEKEYRKESEDALGKLYSIKKRGKRLSKRKDEFADIWTIITTTRNDINHAGMRKKATPAAKIIKQTELIIKQIIDKF